MSFPQELQTFVNDQRWTFAKTMIKWPHEYLVRGRVDQVHFERLVLHIRTYGYEGKFYKKTITYYADAGMVYWTMGAPIEETTIINRCRKEDSYEYHLLKAQSLNRRTIAPTIGFDQVLCGVLVIMFHPLKL